MDDTTNRLVLQLASPTFPGRGAWMLTDAGHHALATDPAGDLDRDPVLDPLVGGTMSPMDDRGISDAHERVDLLLDECLLILARSGYHVGDAAAEVGDRLHPAAARVRRRIALDTEIRNRHAQQAQAGAGA